MIAPYVDVLLEWVGDVFLARGMGLVPVCGRVLHCRVARYVN